MRGGTKVVEPPVSVYTTIQGVTMTVDGGQMEGETQLLGAAMLSDLVLLRERPDIDPALAGLGGIKNGLYVSAFSGLLHSMKDGGTVQETAKEAVLSLGEDEEYINDACRKLERNGIYPGSNAYTGLLHARYYIDKWRNHLLLMESFVEKQAGASCSMS